jgi:hypothetical protein
MRWEIAFRVRKVLPKLAKELRHQDMFIIIYAVIFEFIANLWKILPCLGKSTVST